MTSQPYLAAPPRRLSANTSPACPPAPPGAPPGSPADDPPDHILLEGWRIRGEQHAATRLYRRHFDAIFRFFRNKAADHGDATDLTSETFMRLFHRRDSYPEIHTFRDGHPNVRPFLFGIAKHVLLAYIRKRTRLDLVDLSTQALVDLVPRSPSSIVLACRKLYALSRALRTLAAHDQMLIEAKYFEDMSERELAALLEIPPSTVPGRLRGARTRLTGAVQRHLRTAGTAAATVPPSIELDDLITLLRCELLKGAAKPKR
jgi:RNA polymerase sigma factor (sigma-70 family)